MDGSVLARVIQVVAGGVFVLEFFMKRGPVSRMFNRVHTRTHKSLMLIAGVLLMILGATGGF